MQEEEKMKVKKEKKDNKITDKMAKLTILIHLQAIMKLLNKLEEK